MGQLFGCTTVGQKYLNSLLQWNGKDNFILDNIKKVLDLIGNPENKSNIIHVAGTNGKGSTSVMIGSILNQANFSVGLNISPHLVDVRERISINGKLIAEDVFYSMVDSLAGKIKNKLSYHEFITALAFYCFKKLDYSVFEVGLGGRLDASNVITAPKVCIITSIGMDHCNILGDTLEKIAFEKAGIIKRGAKLIIGKMPVEARDVLIKVAKELNVEYFTYEEDFSLFENKFKYKNINFELKPHKFYGNHQLSNIACAITAGILLDVQTVDIINGISNCCWVGRLEIIEKNGFKYLLDAAHNEDGISSLISFLDSSEKYPQLIFGVLNTKNWKSMIDKLIPNIVHWNIVEPDHISAVDAEEICGYLKTKNIIATCYGRDYRKVLEDLETKADNVLVAGSIYLLGSIRSLIKEEEIQYF